MFSRIFLCVVLFTTTITSNAQIAVDATKAKREKFLQYLNKLISTNLSLPLNTQNEEKWADAFYPLELLQKKDSSVDHAIASAVKDIEFRSADFQYALLELLYSNYPLTFKKEIVFFLPKIKDPKTFALAAEYILLTDRNKSTLKYIGYHFNKLKYDKSMIYFMNEFHSNVFMQKTPLQFYSFLADKKYFQKNVLLISFQRKNRNYPGVVIVRDTSGNFITDSSGYLFSVPQLARSISGIPYYFSGGNTPQGFYRMDGYGISKSSAIGPSKNIQMTMPFETSAAQFLNDSSLQNTQMDLDVYRKIPFPAHSDLFYETFSAGLLGRNEIIAHGTTVDPQWYAGKNYYPLTPSLGCLVTKELWNETTGENIYSDQKKLTDAVEKAGGPHGYVLVIDIDDEQKPVTADEVYELLKH